MQVECRTATCVIATLLSANCRWRLVAGTAATLGTGLLVGTALNYFKRRGQQ